MRRDLSTIFFFFFYLCAHAFFRLEEKEKNPNGKQQGGRGDLIWPATVAFLRIEPGAPGQMPPSVSDVSDRGRRRIDLHRETTTDGASRGGRGAGPESR